MTDLLLIAVAAATLNNFVLVRLLGLGPVLGDETRLEEIPGMALATTSVLMVAAGLNYALDQLVLVPYGLPYLRILAVLGSTLLAIQLGRAIFRRPGNQLPLVTLNSVVLGVGLLTSGAADSLAGALARAFGAGAGFGLVVLLFTGLRPRLELAPLPAPLRGPAIALVTAGMMSLAFAGFLGLGT